MCIFFSSVLPCFPFFLLFLTVVLPAGKTVAAGGDDEVLCSWCPPLLLLLFFLLSPLCPFLSLCFFFSVFFVSSPLFCPFPPPSSRCLSQRSWFLFIEPRAWLFTVLMGSSRLVGHWARLPRFGSHRFSGRCVVGGRPVCSVGGLQAREAPTKFKQKLLFPSSPLHVRGKKKEEQYFGLRPP
jgi:hypothetical protein